VRGLNHRAACKRRDDRTGRFTRMLASLVRIKKREYSRESVIESLGGHGGRSSSLPLAPIKTLDLIG